MSILPEVQSETYQFLRHSLEKSKAQDTALEAVINRMESIEGNVLAIRDEVAGVLKQVKDSVYIYYEEQKQLQSHVGKQANDLAQDHYNQDEIPREDREDYGAEIRELAGYATRKQWRALKDEFKVTRYSSIRRVDFDSAIHFLKDFPMGDAFIAEFKQWKEQRRRKQEREELLNKKLDGIVPRAR